MGKHPYREIRVLGKRLELRPYRFTDFKTLRQSHENRLGPLNSFDEPIPTSKEPDYEKHKARIKRHRAHAKEELHFIFGLFDTRNGDYIGQIDFFTINKLQRWGNLGYHIQNQYNGQGYATEGAQLALKVAFRFLGYHRIEAAMEPANKASARVASKIRLRFEGKRLKFFPENGGIDMLVYATNAIDHKN